MKRILTRTVGRCVLTFVFIAIFLLSTGWPQGRWQLHSLPQEKSPDVAQVLSLIGTGIPVGLMIAALSHSGDWDAVGFFLASLGTSVLVPAPGYFYGGLWGRGFSGMGLRALGVAGVILGIGAMDKKTESGAVLLIGGAGLIIGSMIYDLAKVSGAVRRRNLKLHEKTLAISPVYLPQQKALGIHVQIGFD